MQRRHIAVPDRLASRRAAAVQGPKLCEDGCGQVLKCPPLAAHHTRIVHQPLLAQHIGLGLAVAVLQGPGGGLGG